MMTGVDWHLYLSVAVFVGVILTITFDLMPMVVASLLGTAILYLTCTVNLAAHSAARQGADPVDSLLIGGMVIIRALEPTGVYEWTSDKLVRLFAGQGWRLLIGILILTTVVSSVLPNEIAIVLLAPVIIEAARRFKVDVVPLMLVAVFTSNSGGLLTQVGDPATYIGAKAMNASFIEYVHGMTPAAVLALLTLIALMPVIFRDIWRTKLELQPAATGEPKEAPKISRPVVLSLLLFIMGLMILFSVIGDSLPVPIAPELSCLAFATLALAVVHFSRLDSVDAVINDVDWRTIIFLTSVFILVQGLEATGAIHLFAETLAQVLGKNLVVANLTILGAVGFVSGFVPNVPLMATMIPIIKTYVISAGLATPDALLQSASHLPKEVLTLFYTMLLGVTFGGNLTLLGGSANIVACGLCNRIGSRVTFVRFLRYGVPVTVAQLAVSAVYVMWKLAH